MERYARTPRDGVGQRATRVPPAPRKPAASVVALQRGAGNRAVASLLARRTLQRQPKGSIRVHAGSKLSASQFLAKLTGSGKAPRWLINHLRAADGSLITSGDLAPPAGRIWEFTDSLEDAFKSRSWDITTASSTIEVQEGADGKRTWMQMVTPDLQKGEHLGAWVRTGPDQEGLLRTSFFSTDPEVIYGWTEPGQATERTRDQRNFILIVTEIHVTAPSGKKKVFRPGADTIAEAMLHEISVHAGRISEGKPDVHDDRDAVVKDVVNEVGEFFRPTIKDSNELDISPLSKEIFKFVGETR